MMGYSPALRCGSDAPLRGEDELERLIGETVSVGIDHQLKAIRHAEFVEYRRQVVADRRVLDEEAVGDLLVLESFADESDDLALALGERGDLSRLRVNLSLAGVRRFLAEQPVGGSALEPVLAGAINLLDGVKQLPGPVLFEHHALRAELYRLISLLDVTYACQDDDVSILGYAKQLGKEGEAIILAQIKIKHDDIGLLARRYLKGIGTIARLTGHF